MLLCLVMLSTGVAFATSDDAILSEASDEMAIDENALSIADDVSAIESIADSADVLTDGNAGAVVTSDNFFNYFDEGGTLLDNVTSDELTFDGDFSGLPIYYINVDKPIKFTYHTGQVGMNKDAHIIDSLSF